MKYSAGRVKHEIDEGTESSMYKINSKYWHKNMKG